jgi:1-phosphofructokinase/tagatose 6-phosphate kinase
LATGTEMITTVTLNTAMDRSLVVPNYLVGRRHRASSGVTLPGGRGVVVARALRALGTPVIASGLAGGLNGANIIERLTTAGILNDFVRIAAPSRTSTAVIDPVTGVHTEINEYGPRVSGDEFGLLVEKLRYLARASRAVVIAGSLPRDLDVDCVQRLLRAAGRSELLTVVTSTDDAAVLRAAMAAEPDLVIVEQREAEELVGHEFGGDDDFLLALDEMARMGCHTAIVMHETGCYARCRDGRSATYHAAWHDPVEAVSELGGVDVFTAGYLHSLVHDGDTTPADRLRYALAVSLANRRVLGAGVFERADVSRLLRDTGARDLQPVEQETEA